MTTTFPAVMRAAGWQLVKVADGFRWYRNRVYIKHGLTFAYWFEHGKLPPWCMMGNLKEIKF